MLSNTVKKNIGIAFKNVLVECFDIFKQYFSDNCNVALFEQLSDDVVKDIQLVASKHNDNNIFKPAFLLFDGNINDKCFYITLCVSDLEFEFQHDFDFKFSIKDNYLKDIEVVLPLEEITVIGKYDINVQLKSISSLYNLIANKINYNTTYKHNNNIFDNITIVHILEEGEFGISIDDKDIHEDITKIKDVEYIINNNERSSNDIIKIHGFYKAMEKCLKNIGFYS